MEKAQDIMKGTLDYYARNMPESDDKQEDPKVTCLWCKETYTTSEIVEKYNFNSYDISRESFFVSGYCNPNHKLYDKRKKNLEGYLEHFGVPKRYLKCSFDNYKPETIDVKSIEMIKNIQEIDDTVYICGSVGNGKTHIAVSLLRKLGITYVEGIKFVRATEVLIRLRSAFNDGGPSENDVFKEFTGKEILAIDDIGTEKLTDYVIQSWYRIIDYRYSNYLPTIFTSNMSMPELASRFGDRIASRLSSGLVFTLHGSDGRLKK